MIIAAVRDCQCYNSYEPEATTLATRMATTAPQLELFNSQKDNWNSWSRRFKQWLTLSSYATGEGSEAKHRGAFWEFNLTFNLQINIRQH